MSTNLGPVLNISNVDPNLKTLLDYFKKDIFLSMNCHAVATVQSFDSSKQTAICQINYSKTYNTLQADGTYASTQTQYPLLLDCPVIVLGGGTGSLTFPIQQGDQALILFNDRDLNNWVAGATSGPLATNELHTLSNAIALIGPRQSTNPVSNYDMTQAVLQYGMNGAMVGVGESLITIANNITTLNTVLQDILTQLETLANTVCVPGNPLNPAVAIALNALGTTLGELLG